MTEAESQAGMARVTQAFGLLLLVIFTSICFQLAAPSETWARIVTIALQGGVLVLALQVSRTHLLHNRSMTAAVLLAMTLGVVAVLVTAGNAAALAHAIALGITVFAIAAITLGIAAEARAHGGVNIRTVAGGLSIYLLLGMLFSTTYQLVDDLSSGGFFQQAGDPTTAEFLYYSFITLTTTGFGDLTAATDVGRSITVAEALIGQIYLVTVVALIVANLRPQRRQDAST